MLKPDAISRNLAGEIISRIEAKGYLISDIKRINLSSEILKEHYAHVLTEPFYPRLEEYMMSGPVWGLIIEGENAVLGMRKLIGATRFEDALPGTIRGDFGKSTTENVIHGSDSVESALVEIERFFNK